MDKDRIAGAAKEAKGSVKEAIGNATGDAKLQSSGKMDKVEGKTQNAIGGAKDAVREAVKQADK
ncbi:MAG: CsbD family protein [Bradyrhizobium sp.]|nr:MAG: CsbD family protein [Bradyrhizobium sp.]